MVKIKIKPLSVNKAWQGKRYKSEEYKAFEEEFYYSIPTQKVPEGKLKVHYEWGLSSKLMDIDNPIKQAQDVISKRLGFNDRMIYELHIKKVDVKKGEEYIKFKIESMKDA